MIFAKGVTELDLVTRITTGYRGVCLYVLLVLAFLATGVSNSWAVEIPYINEFEDRTILVGVRDGSDPFSYKKSTKNDEDILEGYGGYMVEVCRSVLRQLVGTGAFQGYHVKAVKVTASDRFDKLRAREVDMLCGPDSITTARLHRYNVSHPIFLSGIALATIPLSRFPLTAYCGPILGLVRGTTAQIAGVKAIFDAGLFQRFSPPIQQYMSLSGDSEIELNLRSIEDVWSLFEKNIFTDGRSSESPVNGENGVPPNLVTTAECRKGFIEGPVIEYTDHSKGMNDLCAGKLLFYLGDVDIIKRKKPDNCDIEISRQTYTKEAYGIYFRKFSSVLRQPPDQLESWDAVLYSYFNNTLLTQMQDSENVLENQYISEFGDAEMASDLELFFKSFQYATNF